MIRLSLALATVTAAGALALGYAAWADAARTPPTPDLTGPGGGVNVGSIPINGAIEVILPLTNPSVWPCRVVGAPSLCQEAGCHIVTSPGGRFVVPAGGTVDLVCKVTVVEAGPFEMLIPVYYDSGGVRTLRIAITGTGVPAQGVPHDPSAGR